MKFHYEKDTAPDGLLVHYSLILRRNIVQRRNQTIYTNVTTSFLFRNAIEKTLDFPKIIEGFSFFFRPLFWPVFRVLASVWRPSPIFFIFGVRPWGLDHACFLRSRASAILPFDDNPSHTGKSSCFFTFPSCCRGRTSGSRRGRGFLGGPSKKNGTTGRRGRLVVPGVGNGTDGLRSVYVFERGTSARVGKAPGGL